MTSEKEAQTIAVLDWINTHGTITPLEAKDHLGVMRLAARIFDIKQGNGCPPTPIDMRLVTVSNRYGESCRVAEYRLAAWRPVEQPRITEGFTGTPMLFDY